VRFSRQLLEQGKLKIPVLSNKATAMAGA